MSVMNWIGLVLARRAGRVPVRGAAVSGEIRMNALGIFQIVLYMVVLVALVKPLGAFMARVYAGRAHVPVAGARPDRARHLSPRRRRPERRSRTGSATRLRVLLFNFIGFVVVYLLQRLQGVLPLNPQGFAAVSPDSSFNTAVSFATQHELAGLRRRGDDELSHADARARGAELPVRGSGMAVLVALIRGFVRRQARARSATSTSTSRAARSTSCCRCRCCSRSS